MILMTCCAFLATLGARVMDPRLGRYARVACAIAYPLLLLESTGKAIFLRGIVRGPTPALLFAAVTFSTITAFAVMRLGTGPVRERLRRFLDAANPGIPDR
jgi:hypothetical protein